MAPASPAFPLSQHQMLSPSSASLTPHNQHNTASAITHDTNAYNIQIPHTHHHQQQQRQQLHQNYQGNLQKSMRYLRSCKTWPLPAGVAYSQSGGKRRAWKAHRPMNGDRYLATLAVRRLRQPVQLIQRGVGGIDGIRGNRGRGMGVRVVGAGARGGRGLARGSVAYWRTLRRAQSLICGSS